MKKYLFIASVLFLISTVLFSACKEKEEEPENPFRENIIGQWKLNHIYVIVEETQRYTINYSDKNVIFDFQENNKLVVHGSIPNDLGLFDDFQEGEHFYEYRRPEVYTYSSPGTNLFIDNPELGDWRGWYWCFSISDRETMDIESIFNVKINDLHYMWWYNLYKLN